MTAHEALRAATAAAHEAVDAAFAGFDLGDAAQYCAFLARHAAAFIPAEAALSAAGADRLIPGWEAMRRTPALLADLDAMGMAVPQPRTPPAYDSDESVLGGAYVLEGSRLGGDLLRRSVGSDLPRAFLDSIHPPGHWRAFVALLNRSLYETNQRDAAIAAALGTFALFA